MANPGDRITGSSSLLNYAELLVGKRFASFPRTCLHGISHSYSYYSYSYVSSDDSDRPKQPRVGFLNLE